MHEIVDVRTYQISHLSNSVIDIYFYRNQVPYILLLVDPAQQINHGKSIDHDSRRRKTTQLKRLKKQQMQLKMEPEK